MSANLVLGCSAAFIGLASLFVRFALPRPKGWTNDPYVRLMRTGWFSPLVFGLVPLIAGLAFLGAWRQERRDVPYAVAHYEHAATLADHDR